MLLAPDWFALQLAFAGRAAAIDGSPLAQALLECTNLYRRLGLGRSRDPDHPVWRDFLRNLAAAPDPETFAAARCVAPEAPPGVGVGCFHYDNEPATRTIRLHFTNRDDSGAGPLSRARTPVRRAELGALFAEIAETHPAVETVRGVSWLHGVDAYRRLFPPAYGASARPVPTRRVLASMPLWGQFLDHRGHVKPALAAVFLARVDAAATADDLATCFPHPVYAVSCDIERFYRFYGVEPRAATDAAP